MFQFDIHFTLAQANALIPWVRRIFSQVHQISATIPPRHLGDQSEEEHEALVSASPMSHMLTFDHEAALRRGYHPWVHNVTTPPAAALIDQAWRSLTTQEKMELIGGLIQALIDKGIIIQDVARGLIDFPAIIHATEEVLLCYELKDGSEIIAWHPLHTGFAGRRDISELPE